MQKQERVILVETFDERDLPIRESAEPTAWCGCGPERGEYEDRAKSAAQYVPPRHEYLA